MGRRSDPAVAASLPELRLGGAFPIAAALITGTVLAVVWLAVVGARMWRQGRAG